MIIAVIYATLKAVAKRKPEKNSGLNGYITNSYNDQLPVGLIAQLVLLVEHCTGIAEVMGSNPVQA